MKTADVIVLLAVWLARDTEQNRAVEDYDLRAP
jgi:hypothetical protein